MPHRATASQLRNAGLAMVLAEGTTEHTARTAAFLDLLDTAWPWVQLYAAARVAAWRLGPVGRRMRRGAL